MKYICAFLTLMLLVSTLAKDNKRHETFKHSNLYTLKLSLSELQRGFRENNLKVILTRFADNYKENGVSYKKNDCISRIEKIFSLKTCLTSENSKDPELFLQIVNLSRNADSASAEIQFISYTYEDSDPIRHEVTANLDLIRCGSGWQIYNSDGLLSKMETIFSGEPKESENKTEDMKKGNNNE